MRLHAQRTHGSLIIVQMCCFFVFFLQRVVAFWCVSVLQINKRTFPDFRERSLPKEVIIRAFKNLQSFFQAILGSKSARVCLMLERLSRSRNFQKMDHWVRWSEQSLTLTRSGYRSQSWLGYSSGLLLRKHICAASDLFVSSLRGARCCTSIWNHSAKQTERRLDHHSWRGTIPLSNNNGK